VVRIGITGEFVRPGRVGGTEQALRNLVDGIVHTLSTNDRLTLVGDEVASCDRRPQVHVVEPPRRVGLRFLQETLTYRAYGPSVDAYYFPNYFTPPGRHPCRTVTTIPDLQYLHLPENFSWRKRRWLRWAHRHTLQSADAVTVYSDFVLQDILEHYGETHTGRIVVAPIPVVWPADVGERRLAVVRPYVLTVASHYRHKNLATLLRAFALVHRDLPDVELVMAGQLGGNLVGVSQAEDVPALVNELGLGAHVRVTGYVGDDDIADLYRGAELFVFPSLFEGFGLPPVEALGYGLPVITTDRASLPEVTRGLAHYVSDPSDPEELAAAMLERLASGRRPSKEDVDGLRAFYAPERIGRQFYDILTGSR
jgi:glycosyltransferase involved in cell wall biosynthesis